jgi:acetyltransferase-like isoleucine patch superfamily enzyme
MYRYIKRTRKLLYYLFNFRRYKSLHYTAFIESPILITPQHVVFEKYVSIFKHCRIQGITNYNSKTYNPLITFEENVSCQQNLHLTCAEQIRIGKNTAIAANVTITDINHSYDDIEISIERQDISVKPVKIGEDCKIYNGAVILPGTIIGKHCVIGANSVAFGSFPDFSIITGNPARIIKRYSFEKKKWLKTNEKGEFSDE